MRRGLHRGDKFKGNAAFVYLPKSVGLLIASAGCTRVGFKHKHHAVLMLLSRFPALTQAFNKHTINLQHL